MGNQWGDIYLCVPQPKCWGTCPPRPRYNRRPWPHLSYICLVFIFFLLYNCYATAVLLTHDLYARLLRVCSINTQNKYSNLDFCCACHCDAAE